MTEPAGTPANATRTTSKTGGAKDVKIERFDQIPAGPLAELAARYGIGSLKYPQVNGLDNWRNGYPWSYSYRALVGHANAFWAGEDVDPAAYLGTDDPDSFTLHGEPRPGVTHLAAVAWHAFALLHWAETHPEYDDRESTVLARQAAGLSDTEDESLPAGSITGAQIGFPEPVLESFTYPNTTIKPKKLEDQGSIVVTGNMPQAGIDLINTAFDKTFGVPPRPRFEIFENVWYGMFGTVEASVVGVRALSGGGFSYTITARESGVVSYDVPEAMLESL